MPRGCAWTYVRCRMLILVCTALCLKTSSVAGDMRTVPARLGPGMGNIAQIHLMDSHSAGRKHSDGSISPSSSPVSSRPSSGVDVRQCRSKGEEIFCPLVHAVQLAQKARERSVQRTGSFKFMPRTVSFRSGLSNTAEVPSPRRREDHEYRARHDPNSEVYTRLKTGLYPDLLL